MDKKGRAKYELKNELKIEQNGKQRIEKANQSIAQRTNEVTAFQKVALD